MAKTVIATMDSKQKQILKRKPYEYYRTICIQYAIKVTNKQTKRLWKPSF